MALFKRTTKKEASPKAKNAKTADGVPAYRADALIRPQMTEKAAILAEKGTYVFEISPKANKCEVADAVRATYKVHPVRVNIINLPRTRVFVRGKHGMTSGIRKALVTLAKGEKIELI